MKKLMFCILFIFGSYMTGLSRTANELIELKETSRFRYILHTSTLEAIVLNMPFGEKIIINEIDRQRIQKANVKLIELVFTDFPKGDDLKTLNLSRIKMVESIRKSLVSDESIQWKIIRQTDCKNEAEAKTLFHGIIIHFQAEQNDETHKKDIISSEHLLPADSTIKNVADLRKSLPDSSVLKILERHKNWKELTVVADLTGSMSPYTGQLVLWFKLKEKDKINPIKNVLFFNDGNNTPDREKIIGHTGGTYFLSSTNYETIRKLAMLTISNGYGGDAPENNLEAVLEAIQKVPEAKEIIMIADNYAPVKDLELLDKIKIPVRIILCGTMGGINPQYLNIAYKTGGSVHTMEQDLENLVSKSEGAVFKFKGETFMVKNGVIVKVTTL